MPTAAITARTTGGKNSGVASRLAALTNRAGMTRARKRSPRIGGVAAEATRVTWSKSLLWLSYLGPLRDVVALRRHSRRRRVVRQHVGRQGKVDRSRNVRVDQRHLGPVRQLGDHLIVELLLGHVACHSVDNLLALFR